MSTQNTNSSNILVAENMSKYTDFITEWQTGFTSRIKQALKSTKHIFTINDAIDKSEGKRTPLDNVFIEHFKFISLNPLRENDYYKYLNSYKNGKTLNEKYFKHDLELLHQLYKKVDENPSYTPFSKTNWEKYVLFMLLKFKGMYKPEEMDEIFNVKTDENREYNPITSLSRPLRGMLPQSLKLKEFDIYRAYPTFIDLELGNNREIDVYSLIDKRNYNRLLNTHNEVENATIESVRNELRCVYDNRVDEVITEERFNNKGQMFRDLSKYEAQYINEFVNANKIKKYVRLHDAVIVLENTEIAQTEFGLVKFSCKDVEPPAIVNNLKSFYQINADNKVITEPVYYKEFFLQENFVRVTEQDVDKITIFRDSNNVVIPFNHKTDAISFLSKNINEYDTSEVENKISKDYNNIHNSFLLIEPKKLIYYSDSQNEFGIPFKNGFFKYTKGDEQTQTLEYKEVNGFFAQHPTQERNFEFKDYTEPCEFERFLTMVSVAKDPLNEQFTDEEDNTRMQFFRMFGYLCHSYKDQSFSPAIILSDKEADDISRKGGRGKSLITIALQNVRNTKIKGSSEFDGSYRHKFADLEREHKIYVIDDVVAGFNYDDLYTNITGGITCEHKGKTAITIPFKDAPKFVITTNWAVRYDAEATSTNRRFLEYKLTNYFNEYNKPNDVFNHRLFEDWDNEEWNRFYNFVYACVGNYLEHGLDAPKYDKEDDNFRAYFSNDVIIEEFERIFNIISNSTDSFNATNFLDLYKSNENPLRNEGYFHHRNIKKFVDAYVKHKKLHFEYNQTNRRWFNKSHF
ncbi:primase-helicase family protein [Myroides odoratimimus]|uniref:primase-helicase family protein n=1 Tax=Myroides odoratimimus TaxID=76832 RepID=UPI0025784A1E|nr:primase-helicase family protein [Myroides odoratimimus]MDM1415058.1 hypothetical protein [Myroides odoratimimus]